MSKELFEVFLGTFNAEPWIEQVIGSLEAQDCAPFKVKIIDNASTDKTTALIEDIFSKNTFIENICTICPFCTCPHSAHERSRRGARKQPHGVIFYPFCPGGLLLPRCQRSKYSPLTVFAPFLCGPMPGYTAPSIFPKVVLPRSFWCTGGFAVV